MTRLYLQRNQKAVSPIPKEKDVFVDTLLGQGAFCTIKEVKSLHQLQDTKCNHISIISHSRDPQNQTILKYAIKQVRADLEPENRPSAVIDLKNEANFLSNLSHPNIIQIYGVGGMDDESNSFLLLERLSCVLETQCQNWKKSKKGIKRGNIGAKAALWNERIAVAQDFANAMTYLHKSSIMHRDLKLANCGFDANGKFKLFDFGLATKLTQEKRIAPNQYKLSGFTGTRRYMAPEVFQCIPYGKPADVYSFGLILWEIMSLERAFQDETVDSLSEKVYGKKNFRPKVKSKWPRTFKHLICKCWLADPSIRPSFVDIKSTLQDCQL